MSQTENQNNNLEGKNNNDSNIVKDGVGNSDSVKESKSQSQDPRQLIRERFDKYLTESKKENDEEKFNEVLDRIKEMPESDDYNLIIRKKAGKPSGLIILNKFKPGKYKKVQEAEKEEKEKEKEKETEEKKDVPLPEKTEKDREIIDSPMEDEDHSEKKKTEDKKLIIKLPKPHNPRKAKTTKKMPVNNEDSLKSLNNEIKKIWERLNKYDKKYRIQKLKKTSKKAAKEMASLEGNKDSIIRNDEEMQLFDRLDKRFNPFNPSQTNNFQGSLKYLV